MRAVRNLLLNTLEHSLGLTHPIVLTQQVHHASMHLYRRCAYSNALVFNTAQGGLWYGKTATREG